MFFVQQKLSGSSIVYVCRRAERNYGSLGKISSWTVECKVYEKAECSLEN